MAPLPYHGPLDLGSSQQVNSGTQNSYFSQWRLKLRSEGQHSVLSFSRPRAVPRVFLISSCWNLAGIIANAKYFFCGLAKIWILLIQSQSRFSKPVGLSVMFGIKLYSSVLLPPWDHQVVWKGKICFVWNGGVRRKKVWVGLIGICLIRPIRRRCKDTFDARGYVDEISKPCNAPLSLSSQPTVFYSHMIKAIISFDFCRNFY